MNMDFANGMRAAMRLIQAQKLMEATRVLRRTLSSGEESEPAPRQASEARAIEGRVIDVTAEVIEPEVTSVPEAEASIASGLSLPPSAGVWARRMDEMVQRRGDAGFSPLGLDALTSARPTQDARHSGWRSVPEPVLCLRGREPNLQALRSASPGGERMRAAGDAAWRHPGRRRLRGGDAHERPCRGAWIYRRLSEPVESRECVHVLELVHARAPKTRRRRAFDHRRDHQRNRGQL